MAGKGKIAKKLDIIQKPLLDRIRAGTPIRQACASVGLSKDTFYDWMRRGEVASSGHHKDFYDAVEKAKADAVIESVLIVRKAAKENWQAAAWYLERCHPDEFAKRGENYKVEHSGGVNISLQLADCSKREDECNTTHATKSSLKHLPGPKE